MNDIVERARKALDGVTEGPWTQHTQGKHPYPYVCGAPQMYEFGEDCPVVAYLVGMNLRENQAFIAAARSLVPEMADTIEAQAKEIARLRDALTDEDILLVIAEGISDGWDSDCTNRSMAICVLNEIRRQGFQIVKRAEEDPAP